MSELCGYIPTSKNEHPFRKNFETHHCVRGMEVNIHETWVRRNKWAGSRTQNDMPTRYTAHFSILASYLKGPFTYEMTFSFKHSDVGALST